MFNGDASMRKQVSYRFMKTIDISSFKGLNILSKVTYGIIISLTREHSQVIPSVCLHILPTCKGYYSKKKPKRIWALIASFKSYEVFRFLYSKVHNTKIFIS